MSSLNDPEAPSPRRAAGTGALSLAVLLALLALGGLAWQRLGARHAAPAAEPAAAPEPAAAHPVTIRPRPRDAAIATGLTGPDGQPILASCATCHATRPANAKLRDAAELKTFHQGLTKKHGELACVSCHNAADGYMTFRLADGRAVPFDQPMQLCAQCHGTQHRDYLHGAHGGMTGHWDLARGPRVRNSCVECHDAHAPAIRPVTPAPGPRDRFLPARSHSHE